MNGAGNVFGNGSGNALGNDSGNNSGSGSGNGSGSGSLVVLQIILGRIWQRQAKIL